jgi:hypothetical protein
MKKMPAITTEQLYIQKLSDKRYDYINEREDSWDEESGHYTVDENPDIDILAIQILEKIKEWRANLTFEFIFEELTKLGQAPCLLYDDNGHFAISGDGFCSVSTEIQDWEGFCSAEKDSWKNTIREALDYYLDIYLEEEEE